MHENRRRKNALYVKFSHLFGTKSAFIKKITLFPVNSYDLYIFVLVRIQKKLLHWSLLRWFIIRWVSDIRQFKGGPKKLCPNKNV